MNFTHWAPGEPDGLDDAQHCVAMDTESFPGRWKDVDCSQSLHVACRTDIGQCGHH